MVKTTPYRIDLAEMRRVSVRSNYRRFWLLSLSSALVGGLVALTNRGLWPFAALVAVFGILAPYLRTLLMLAKLKSAPLMHKEYAMEFDPQEMRQFEGDDISARVRYADLVKVNEHPEGLQLWLTALSWVLVPKRAFATTGDLATAKHYIHQARGGLQ